MLVTGYEEELIKTIRRLGYSPEDVLTVLQGVAKLDKDKVTEKDISKTLAGLKRKMRGVSTGDILHEKIYLALPSVNEADRDRVLELFYGSFPEIGGGIKDTTVILEQDTFYESAVELHNNEEVKVIVQKIGSEWKCVAYKMS